MTSKTYLITGVAGFIGSNTAESLLKKGHRVVGLDNFAPVYSPEKKRFNLKRLQELAPSGEQFNFVEGDLRNYEDLAAAVALKPLDAILHLGALAGVQPSIQDPVGVYDVNVKGTLHVLEAARQHNVGSLVFASSSSVYGKNSIPFKESDRVDHPLSPYAASKRAGELMAHAYHHIHGLNIACLRFFTVYGPRQRPDLAIYKFTRAMLRGETITLYGDGSSSRDYTYIEDCVHGIEASLKWVENSSPAKPRFDIFNLGESQTVNLHQLVEHLEKNLGVPAKKIYKDYLPGDVYASFADLSHSEQVLGYRPQVPFEEGIRKFCEWFLKEEQGQPWV